MNFKFSIILLCFMILSSLSLTAQRSISGYVYDSVNHNPIDNVLCLLVSTKGSPSNIYSFSDESGAFNIQYFDNETDSIRFSLLGYQEQTFPVSLLLHKSKVSLNPSENLLQEIIVSAPNIREKGDTLVYNVGNYISQNDRYIADILKKLPGVTVNGNGSINYQGEAINKFYIEGRDLLGGNYSLASNNLDVDAVGSVEIIEHNQHIRSLNGVEPSNRAAINIKLKNKYLIRPFGEVNLGYGYRSIYNGNLITSLLSKKTQALISIKANNSGENIISELDDKLDISSILTFIPSYENILNNLFFQTPPLSINRYRFNKTIISSGNLLIPFSSTSEMKLNIAYGSDKVYPQYSMQRSMMLGNDNILNLFEYTSGKTSFNNLKISSTYELNSSSLYLKDEFEFNSYKNCASTTILTNTDSINANTHICPLNFKNRLNFVYRTMSDKIISFQSNTHFGSANEDMKNLYGLSEEPVHALFNNKYIITKNIIGSSIPLLNTRLGIDAMFNYSKYNYNIQNIFKNTFTTNSLDSIPKFGTFDYSKSEIGILPSINFKWLNEAISLTIKGNTWLYTLSNKNSGKNKILFLPNIISVFKLSHKLESRININRTFDYVGGYSLFDFPFIKSYRSIYLPANNINYRTGYTASLNLKYRDISNLFFGNINILYKSTKNNYTPTSYNTEEWSIITTSDKSSHSSLIRLQADLNKTFSSIKTSVTLTPIYTKNLTELFQQNIFTKNSYTTYELNLKISNNKLKWFYFDSSFTGKLLTNKNKFTPTKDLLNLYSSINLSFYPIKNLTLNLDGELINQKRDSKFDNNFFFDSSVSYDYKRLNFNLSIKNIFNNKSYTITEFSSVNEYIQTFPLRGREIMLSLRLRF